jgi:hypothetical protein
LVAITGTNFQLAPVPPASGPTTAPNPSVEVLFGATRSPEVRVLTTGLLHVTSPISDPGLVSVTVRNIDQAGVVVPGETVTAANAFTFARPVLETNATTEDDLVRCVRAVMVELARQVIDNVELTVNTDYDDAPDGANIAYLSKLPGLVLVGPTLRENRFFSENTPRSVALGGGQFREQRPARTVDLVFTLIGVDDATIRGLSLLKEVTAFFQGNKVLRMLRDPTVPGTYVQYEMDIEPGADFAFTSATPGNANVRSFSGSFVVRGLDIDDADMSRIQTTALVDAVAVGAVGVDGVLPSPIILTGQSGVSPPPADPLPAGPPAAVGQTGPLEQIAPTFPVGPS